MLQVALAPLPSFYNYYNYHLSLYLDPMIPRSSLSSPKSSLS
jgi:hypothetical protein